MTFSTLGLSAPILKAIADKGYETPTPIQSEAIPAVLSGVDVMAAAQTGTGKTAGFTLPILQKLSGGPSVKANQVRVLVLTPTRELAAQVAESVETYGKYLDLKTAVVFGGVKINPQMIKLRKGVDILVATPGRLLDLYNQNAVRFNQLEILVLDEADRMLDMGFMPDIRRIMNVLPAKRQNLMFSATFSQPIRQLARTIVNQPLEISVASENTTATTVKQWVCPVDKKRKPEVLVKLIRSNDWGQVLVFTRTKHGANRLTRDLEANGITATAIHGNKSQGARTRALSEFKQGEVQVLVATDIAARGLDIDQLPQVVNFDLPNVPEDYVHRIGRTGRAGAEGQAVSLVCADEFPELADIERLIQQLLERETLAGFEPVTPLPESRLNARPPRKKKPQRSHADQRPAKKHSSSRAAAGDKNSAPARQRSARRRPDDAQPNRTANDGNSADAGGKKVASDSPSGRRRPAKNHRGRNESAQGNRLRQGSSGAGTSGNSTSGNSASGNSASRNSTSESRAAGREVSGNTTSRSNASDYSPYGKTPNGKNKPAPNSTGQKRRPAGNSSGRANQKSF